MSWYIVRTPVHRPVFTQVAQYPNWDDIISYIKPIFLTNTVPNKWAILSLFKDFNGISIIYILLGYQIKKK